jgi:four helix bundle protein
MMSSKEQVASSRKDDKGYRRVIAFQKADALASRCFEIAEKVATRDGWLASQLKRAALSAPLNIVEGHGRGTLKDFLRFLETAKSSLDEVEYLLDFMLRKGRIGEAEYADAEALRREATAVLHGLIRALRLRQKNTNEWQRTLSEGHVEYITDGDYT